MTEPLDLTVKTTVPKTIPAVAGKIRKLIRRQ